MVRMGIIGLGYWGPNLARVLSRLPNCRLTAICDRDGRRLQEMCSKYPDVYATTEHQRVLTRDLVDAVVIATPTRTHYALTKQALELGIHTFIEKPLATSSAECHDLIHVSQRTNTVLFVGHVFLYSAAVAKLGQLVSSGELGDVCYISSSRLNLGPVRHDVNALWDLAPHDISIILELMGTTPHSVSCSGLARLNDKLHDVCNLTLHFDDRRMGIVHVSWLDPHKKRVMTVVGSRKMAVYDDVEPLEKIKVYDIGIDIPPSTDSFGEFQYSYRYGDMFSPRIREIEPLKAECGSFVECIMQADTPKTDGYNGLQVVRVIEAADTSLHSGGGRVPLTPLPAELLRERRAARELVAY
jgi:predicted dehydrogenase